VENINITEQLNKFKKLINAKSGEVILEQANNISTDIKIVQKEMSMGMLNNTDEQKVVDVLKKYAKDKSTFQNFINQYKKIAGTELTDELPKHFQASKDKTEIADLNSALSKLGVKFEVTVSPDRSKFVASFKGLDAPTTVTPPATDRQKNINITFCSVKNGIIVNPSSYYNNTSWEDWKKIQKPTDAEIEVAKKSCPQRRRNPAKLGATVNDRFTKSAQSLGIQNGKMDVDTLQKILTSLEGSETKAKTANDFSPQGVPADAFNPQEVPDTNL